MRAVCVTIAALALVASHAPAQIVPGTRAPQDAADAIELAHGLLCTLAAAGRPVPGLNMDLLGGEGMTQLDTLPDALGRFVSKAPQQRIVTIKAPGDPVWVVHDASSGRCTIYSFTAATPVQTKMLAALDQPGAWKRQKNAAVGVSAAYEWKITREVRLRTEISLPRSPGEPVTIMVLPA